MGCFFYCISFYIRSHFGSSLLVPRLRYSENDISGSATCCSSLEYVPTRRYHLRLLCYRSFRSPKFGLSTGFRMSFVFAVSLPPEPGPKTATDFLYPNLDSLVHDCWHDHGYLNVPVLGSVAHWFTQATFEQVLDLFHNHGNSLAFDELRNFLVVVPARFPRFARSFGAYERDHD